MGYGWESRQGQVVKDAALNVPIAFQTIGDKGGVGITAMTSITVLSFGVLVTTAVTATAAVSALDKRPTYGSETNRVEIARFNVPIGTTAGKVVYKEVNVDVEPGEQLIVELLAQSTAGGGIYYIEWIPRSNKPAVMIASL